MVTDIKERMAEGRLLKIESDIKTKMELLSGLTKRFNKLEKQVNLMAETLNVNINV